MIPVRRPRAAQPTQLTPNDFAGMVEVSDDLDTEVSRLSGALFSVADRCSDATLRCDLLKEAYQKYAADLAKRLRMEDAKKSETRIVSETDADAGYRAKRRDYLEAKALADKWESLKEAMVQKGFMLRLKVELYLRHLTPNDVIKSATKPTDLEYHAARERLAQAAHRKNTGA